MGLSNESSGGGLYLNFKDGKIINGGKEYISFEGFIVDMSIEEAEYNKKPYQKVTLFMKDEMDNIWKFGFPMSSGYGYSFFAMSPNINFKKSVTISGGSEVLDNGNKFGKMYIQQDGSYIKWFYKKGSKDYDKIPLAKEVKVGRDIVKDYTDRDAFIEKILYYIFEKKIKKAWPGGVKDKSTKKAQQSDNDSSGSSLDDGLPF